MSEILVEKNKEEELPIPHIWRPIFKNIVKAFVNRDYNLSLGVNNVNLVSDKTAEQIQEYIEDYGEELIDLPDETWDTSVYICYGEYWNVIIDLFTKNEGLSDLVLNAEVSEKDNSYAVDINLVYVP
ncbi:hypothetical protein J7E50_24670 [Pedobacter sp. ISL-68]|uniref:DUF7668 domain-containing protein n=1 Tax=unclassified Pedobacter TaxID=2628915 RepID=UPI001BEAA67D|nr:MULTISPECIES: hypothetical protein [unclassified Pedobacter]MBT2564881.1 hypothetical protein [Pedobacter sp. ISL-64]MBT2593438.1 hypothetical protein [Pedobacter sp. ISL-68]